MEVEQLGYFTPVFIDHIRTPNEKPCFMDESCHMRRIDGGSRRVGNRGLLDPGGGAYAII